MFGELEAVQAHVCGTQQDLVQQGLEGTDGAHTAYATGLHCLMCAACRGDQVRPKTSCMHRDQACREPIRGHFVSVAYTAICI